MHTDEHRYPSFPRSCVVTRVFDAPRASAHPMKERMHGVTEKLFYLCASVEKTNKVK